MSKIQVHILILFQFRGVQLGAGKDKESQIQQCKQEEKDRMWKQICICIGVCKRRPVVGLYLAGLFALHDLEDCVFESVVDKGCGCGLHVLLHQCAGQCRCSEQCCGLVWL